MSPFSPTLSEASGIPLLGVDRASRSFGGLAAVSNVTLTLERGQVVGLIGPNGSGKTTLLNLITAIYPLSSGTIRLDGEEVSRKAAYQLARMGVSRTFQNPRIFEHLTTVQHLLISAPQPTEGSRFPNVLSSLFQRWKPLIDDILPILEQVGLCDDAARLATDLPYGKRRRLELARCLASRPRLLLLDEPTAGLTDEETEDLRQVLLQVVEDHNLCLLVVEHKIDFLRALCGSLFVMNQGRLICQGPTDEVLQDPEVVAAYLGEV